MHIDYTRGDQLPIEFPLVDDGGNKLLPTDIDEITMTCRKEPYISSEIIFEKRFTRGEIEYNEADEVYVVKMQTGDTKKCDYETYGYDIEVKMGEIVDTTAGTIKIGVEYTMEG